MENIVKPILMSAAADKMFQVVIVLIVMDTIFGTLRAVKFREFNSTVGINGMIRKAGMLISLIGMVVLDNIVSFNLIGFVPEALRGQLPTDNVGIMEFFALLYIAYELVSVLKNMTLSGLPVKRIWVAVKKFLHTNTGEVVDLELEDLEADETKIDEKEN